LTRATRVDAASTRDWRRADRAASRLARATVDEDQLKRRRNGVAAHTVLVRPLPDGLLDVYPLSTKINPSRVDVTLNRRHFEGCPRLELLPDTAVA
jgi:hypothetical protein